LAFWLGIEYERLGKNPVERQPWVAEKQIIKVN